MDFILYRYLLRRLLKYPITFSRNKNFNNYDSEEGRTAIKRAKVLKELLKEFSSKEKDIIVEHLDNNYTVVVKDNKLHVEKKYILDLFEKDMVLRYIDESYFGYFNGK